MFIPFLAAAAVAAAFAQVGAMSVKIAFLTSALNAMVLIAIALAVFAIWNHRKVWPTERTCMDLAGLNLLMDSATN